MVAARVVVPATANGLHPTVLPAILRQRVPATVYPCDYETAYYDLVASLWAAGEDFAIVEHDIELSGGAIALGLEHPMALGELAAFSACPEWWCAHSYEVFAGDVATAYGGPFALGCTRFRAELMDRWPDAVEEAGKMDIHPVHPPRSYAVMDSTLTQVLRSRSVPVHQHFPGVAHHHHYMREGTIYG